MQKKLVFTLLLMAVFVCGVFAQIDFSIGGGGLFDYSLRNGIKVEIDDNTTQYGGNRNMSIGGFIFFDVTYAELSVYYAHGSLSTVYDDGNDKKVNSNPVDGKTIKPLSASQLGFSLLGKYPIKMGSFTFFPLLGVDYNIVISVKNESKSVYPKKGEDGKDTNETAGWNNQFGFLAGIGGDINLGKSVFLRMEGLFHMRLPSKVNKEVMDAAIEAGIKKDKINATLGMGPQIKIGVGYRF